MYFHFNVLDVHALQLGNTIRMKANNHKEAVKVQDTIKYIGLCLDKSTQTILKIEWQYSLLSSQLPLTTPFNHTEHPPLYHTELLHNAKRETTHDLPPQRKHHTHHEDRGAGLRVSPHGPDAPARLRFREPHEWQHRAVCYSWVPPWCLLSL